MRWVLDPSIVTGLSAMAAAYVLAVRQGHRDRGYPIEPWRAAAFLSALGFIFVALTGPLHDLSESQLFSAHMVQHLLLTLVVPPLLLAGTPGWMVRPLLRLPGVATTGALLTRALPACALYSAMVAAWHLPPLYDWALRNHTIHVLEHLLLIGAALLLWWPILSPLPEWPRLAPPAQLLYLFVAGIPMALVAALITLSDDLLYPFYGEAPWQWGLSPLADQRLGGVIMWVPGTLAFLAAMTIVYFRWAGRGAEAEDLLEPRGGIRGTL